MRYQREDILWLDLVREILKKNVREPFEKYVDEFVEFLDRLYVIWNNSDKRLKEKYAYHMAILQANSTKVNIVRARLNAFYAYLVFRGYVSAYRLLKDKIVAGGESLYTWLRLYRELVPHLSTQRPHRQ